MAHKDKKQLSRDDIIKRIQKGIILFSFFTFIGMLIYCFIFFTPYYTLSNLNSIWATGLKEEAIKEAFGLDLSTLPDGVYTKAKLTKNITINLGYFTRIAQASTSEFGYASIQQFNKFLFTYSMIGVLISCLLFIYRSQLRKKYYITNYIVHGIWSVYTMVVAILMLNSMLYWEAETKAVNYDLLNKYYESQEMTTRVSYSQISWIYVVGKVLFVIMVIASITLVAFSIFKFIDNRKYEKQKALVMKGEIENGK